MQAEVKIGEWVQKGFELFKANWQVLVLVNLVAMAISLLTGGILSGPMSAGVALVTLAVLDKRDPAPVVGDVFKGFDFFLPSFLFVLVFGYALAGVSMLLSLIPCLGPILSIFLSLAVPTAVLFGLFLIVDRKMDFWEAAQASYAVVRTNFWPFFALLIVASAIAQLGILLCCVGIVATAPIYFTILAVAYRASFPNEAASGAVPPALDEPPASPAEEPATPTEA